MLFLRPYWMYKRRFKNEIQPFSKSKILSEHFSLVCTISRTSFFLFRFPSGCSFVKLYPYFAGVLPKIITHKYVLFITQLITVYRWSEKEIKQNIIRVRQRKRWRRRQWQWQQWKQWKRDKIAINRFIDCNQKAWQWYHIKPPLLSAIQ